VVVISSPTLSAMVAPLVAENDKIKRSRQILYVDVPGVNRRADVAFRRIVGGIVVSHTHPFLGRSILDEHPLFRSLWGDEAGFSPTNVLI